MTQAVITTCSMKIDSAIPLYLFAKAPVPGKVKTRMQPQLSLKQSAGLAALMIRHCVDQIRRFWPGDLILTVSPDRNDPLFETLKSQYGFEIEVQIQGDLGERMLHVLDQGIQRTGAAVVMGCDVPQIPAEVLTDLYNELQSGNEVVGPARDGGFYILGLNKLDKTLFDHIQWGGSDVLDSLLDNCRERNKPLVKVEELMDIDNMSDLMVLARQMPEYQKFVG